MDVCFMKSCRIDVICDKLAGLSFLAYCILSIMNLFGIPSFLEKVDFPVLAFFALSRIL